MECVVSLIFTSFIYCCIRPTDMSKSGGSSLTRAKVCPGKINHCLVQESRPPGSYRLHGRFTRSLGLVTSELIRRLGEDVLLTHTATTYTPIRTGPPDASDEDDFEHTPEIRHGTIDVFQWLGLKRFFPGNNHIFDPAVRGGASVGPLFFFVIHA